MVLGFESLTRSSLCYNSSMKNIYFLIVILVLIGAGYMTLAKKDTATDTSATAGKIDINAVCEGALAYMTLPDGASADKFVAECKEGKHPDVIERYKSDMGLGDGAAI